MRRATFAAFLLCAGLLLSSSAYSKTWHVRQDGTGDTEYIELAIYWAQPGDTVLVGQGHYYRPPIQLGPIHLISEAGPESTILELAPQDVEQDVHVVVIDGISDGSVIGFTIKGGVNGWLSSGGGIDCINSHVLIRDNVITANWCASGGGIACYGSPAPLIEDNLFCGNGAFGGAAITINDCSPTIQGNTIVDNHASDAAGAIYITGDQSYPVVSHNIIAGNGAATMNAIYSDTPASQISLSCNDAWGNTPSNYGGTLTNQTGSSGNVSADPLFCGVAGSGNYYLQASSPCAEGHVPAYCSGARMGCFPVKCTVAVKKNSWSDIKSLFK